jgi:CheY-like chemotaxis protein
VNPDRPLAGLRILVVEDEFIVAMELREEMERLGATVTAAVATLADAREEAAAKIDGVLLDVQLGSDKTFELAADLQAAGTPFILTTGFDPAMLPEPLRDRPRLSKPFSPAALKRMATDVFRPEC